MRKLILILLCAGCFISCRTFPNVHARQYWSDPSWKETAAFTSLRSGTVSLEADLYEKEILANADRNLELLIQQWNSLLDEPGGAGEAVVDLYLSEYDYLKDFKPLHTLTLTLEIRNEQGELLARYHHGEEKKDSYYSSPFLYGRMEKGFKKLKK